VSAFDEARRAAFMSDLLGVVAGRPHELLPFEVVRRGLGLQHLVDRGLQEVPLERIVGTLGRAGEFNRAFLPRDEALRSRWQEIHDLAEGQHGFAPVELYQVGGSYFVVDGHHRVSVARSLAAPAIEAWVKEFLTPVPLPPEAGIEEILLREGLAEFLRATGLLPAAPDDYRVTVADGYERLLEHVRVHGYYRGIETGRDLPWAEEVASWRDGVYRPMIEVIRKSGILEQFPGRTETDLYLFTMDHLHRLRERYKSPARPPPAPLETLAIAELEQEVREAAPAAGVETGFERWRGRLGRLLRKSRRRGGTSEEGR
jgi:hypothetical protein